jgi:hypothetical protein
MPTSASDYVKAFGLLGKGLGNQFRGDEEKDPLWTWNKDTGQYYNRASREAPQVPAGFKPTAQYKPPPAAVMTRHNEATKDVASINNTLKLLDEAEGLIGEDGQGIFDTATSPYQTALGTSLNVGGALEKGEDWVNKTFGTNLNVIDPDKAVRTSRFQQIMEAESLVLLSKQLKGPTAVQEVMTYKQIIANPNKTNKEKSLAVKAMKATIARDLAAQGKTIQNMERVYPALVDGAAPDAGGDAGGIEEPTPEAIEALQANPELRDEFEEFYHRSADEYLQ